MPAEVVWATTEEWGQASRVTCRDCINLSQPMAFLVAFRRAEEHNRQRHPGTPRLHPSGRLSTAEDRRWHYRGVEVNNTGMAFHVWTRPTPCPWTGKHAFLWQVPFYRSINVGPPEGFEVWRDQLGGWHVRCPAGPGCRRCEGASFPDRAAAMLHINGEASWFEASA